MLCWKGWGWGVMIGRIGASCEVLVWVKGVGVGLLGLLVGVWLRKWVIIVGYSILQW